jgi:outer membrane lipoprotein SlyB
MRRIVRIVVPAIGLALLAACAGPSHRRDAPVYGGAYPDRYADVAYGRVSDIDAIGIPHEQPQGAGAVAGGIIGAIVGRQFGNSSSGKNVGTVAGAVGGAVVGNEIERNARRDGGGVRVTVRLDGGGSRRFDLRDSGGLRVGDRVRLENGQLYRL